MIWKENKLMKCTKSKFYGQSGVSYLELLIVVVIIVVISTIALMNTGSSKPQFSRQNFARDLKVAFERARFDSVKRRTSTTAIQARVIVNATSFTLTTDINQNGTLESSDDRVTNFSTQNITLGGYNSMTLPFTVYFNQRGEAVNSSGASISPIFLMCNATCTSLTATSSNSNIILVTPTGTVNLLPGNATPPTFAVPSPLSTIPTNTNINPLTRIP
jgi:Tfp pilus assembly protein FimT